MKRTFVILFAVMIPLSTLFAAMSEECGPVRQRGTLDPANPRIENLVHRIGNVWMNVTNRGYYGNNGPAQQGTFTDPCSPHM
jgi:hypothetical protein